MTTLLNVAFNTLLISPDATSLKTVLHALLFVLRLAILFFVGANRVENRTKKKKTLREMIRHFKRRDRSILVVLLVGDE